MMSSFQVLIDSDAFVGRFYPNDAHHETASRLFDQLQRQRVYVVTTSMVIDEVATVLSHRQGQASARLFLNTLEQAHFPTIFVDERLRHEALELFVAQTRRGTSVTDCGNVAVLHRYHIPQICSFDRVYATDFKVEVFQ